MISKEKKSHNIGETLIKPCMLKAAGLLLGSTYRKMAKISLLDSTINTPIDELAKNIMCQVLKKLQAFFCQFKVMKKLILTNCHNC